jgi:hypothetical protein
MADVRRGQGRASRDAATSAAVGRFAPWTGVGAASAMTHRSRRGPRLHSLAMGSRGVHFAIDDADAERLLAADGDDAVMAIVEEIEESGERPHADTDKAWDAIHRSLTDGRLEWDNGTYPLNAVILGGRQLHEGEDYVVAYLAPDQVRDVAAALAEVDRDRLRAGYDRIDGEDYEFATDDEDFDYTWSGFADLPPFFTAAAEAGRHVIFTVDP